MPIPNMVISQPDLCQSGNSLIRTPHLRASFKCYENLDCICVALIGSIMQFDLSCSVMSVSSHDTVDTYWNWKMQFQDIVIFSLFNRAVHVFKFVIFPNPFLCSWVRASWIGDNNCPTRCDYIQFCYISADSSTCFGWYPHPSSGAHSNCNYNIWHLSDLICYRPLTRVLTPPRQQTVASTVRPVPDVVITFRVCSWWWMRVSSETCRSVCRKYNKTVYSRILLDIYWQLLTLYIETSGYQLFVH